MLWNEKNADAKGKHPVSLNIAMITLYKQGKSICAKHVAAMHGMKLSYKGKSKEARAQQAEVRQKQRLQKSYPKDKECDVGTTRQRDPFRCMELRESKLQHSLWTVSSMV